MPAFPSKQTLSNHEQPMKGNFHLSFISKITVILVVPRSNLLVISIFPLEIDHHILHTGQNIIFTKLHSRGVLKKNVPHHNNIYKFHFKNRAFIRAPDSIQPVTTMKF